MTDIMTFPNTWEEFEEMYSITDTEQIYTNGSRLIPTFRVRQWLKHLESEQNTADTPQTEERPAGCSKDWSASCTSCERYFSCDYLSGRRTGTGSPIGDYRDGAGAWAPMPLGDPGSISDGTLLTALETWLNRNPDKQIRVDKRITRHGPVFTASIEPAPWTIQKEE